MMDVGMLQAISEAFSAHDVETIMSFFTDDAVFDGPRGAAPWGTRFEGGDAVADAFAARFSGIPDVHYGDDRHFIDGDRGASEWLLTGTTPDGTRIELRGCDQWEFRSGKVSRKDSYWKIVDP
jgi:ketosteroid isomerase-like protein